jgi:hypothetical protein
MRVKLSMLLAVGALAALAVGFMSPADAGRGASNTFRVVKVVNGPVPAGTVFEVEVACTTDTPAAPSEGGASATLQFDEDGNPIGSDSIPADFFESCHAEETEDGGAASVSYACEVSQQSDAPDEGNSQLTCEDDQTVHYGDVAGGLGTITITNTFEAAPPPPPPDVEPDDVVPDVVNASPSFTG